MKVRVKLFAVARELAGGDEITVQVRERATLGEVRRAVEAERPALRAIVPYCLWAVDANYADNATTVNENSEVALIPPVSGG